MKKRLVAELPTLNILQKCPRYIQYSNINVRYDFLFFAFKFTGRQLIVRESYAEKGVAV